MLTLNKVSRFFGGLKAVSDVDMQIDEGRIVGLIGPNGAGKTTLINCISGLDHPTSGEILFKKTPIQNMPAHRITMLGLARTYQNIRLFYEMSVKKNLIVAQHGAGSSTLPESLFWLPRHFRDKEQRTKNAETLLERFRLGDLANTAAGNLPYGAQRRLEMARALALNPQLILLDEPTAGMNPTETREFGEQILRVREEGITLLVIEHDMSLISQVCDEVYVLNFGEILAHDSPQEIKRDSRVIESYLGEEDEVVAQVVAAEDTPS